MLLAAANNDAHAWTDWAKAVVRGATVNQINLKKTLRARVESRLDRIEKQLADIAARLDEPSRAIPTPPEEPPALKVQRARRRGERT